MIFHVKTVRDRRDRNCQKWYFKQYTCVSRCRKDQMVIISLFYCIPNKRNSSGDVYMSNCLTVGSVIQKVYRSVKGWVLSTGHCRVRRGKSVNGKRVYKPQALKWTDYARPAYNYEKKLCSERNVAIQTLKNTLRFLFSEDQCARDQHTSPSKITYITAPHCTCFLTL